MPSKTVNRSQMLKEARRLIIEPGSKRAPRSPPPTPADAISLAPSPAALQRPRAWCASDGAESIGNSSVPAPVATGTAVDEDSNWDDDAKEGSPSASMDLNQAWGAFAAPRPQCCSSAPPPPACGGNNHIRMPWWSLRCYLL
jgi:hypothetical protein